MDPIPNIRETVAAVAAGDVTPVELVQRCQARIERYDAELCAWATLDFDGALREARRLTDMAGRKEIAGPLHGVPIGVKDIIDAAGLPTQAGSPLRRDHVADRDAPVVAALRRAGAIVLGKTVTTEWACFDPPPTRNPWHAERTPGGSSSGSAAALAARMCWGALGTQTGGSIIRPATYCGVCGLKPTFSPEAMAGIVPVSFHLDHVGPMARSIDDVALLYAAMTGRDGAAVAASESPPALALLTSFFMERADDEVRAIVADAWGVLSREARAVPAPALPTDFAELHAHHRAIMAVDAAQQHQLAFEASPKSFGPNVASLLREGLGISATRYAEALRHQQQFRAAMAAMFDDDVLFVTPAANTAAPLRSSTGDPLFHAPFSYSGLPTVCLPCGLTKDGLPVGLQLVGPPWSEDRLLAAAAWCERRLAFAALPPGLA
ncbi:MAG: amidase [Planctomycetales bacterium]|nr:amidase [Planctomycetales bacterium]